MSDANETGDIDPGRLMSFVRRWWAPLFSIATACAYLYSTVRTVEAHARRIDKLEEISVATYVNATLACVESGAKGCVTFNQLERGEIPDLHPPELRRDKK